MRRHGGPLNSIATHENKEELLRETDVDDLAVQIAELLSRFAGEREFFEVFNQRF